MTGYEKYCDDVINGRVVVGELIQLAVKRHLNDLDAAKRGESPFIFHPGYAEHVIQFVKRMKHGKGIYANRPFDLQPYQEFMLAVAFGWLTRHADTGDWVRRYTKIYNEVARKNGKTELMAAVGNYGLMNDGEAGAEIYSAATKINQAKIVFDASKSMLRKFKKENPFLTDLTIQKDNITFMSTESKYEPLPADAETLDGSNPHFALIDELHAHPDDRLFKVLETGMGARTQPLMMIITTAGFNVFGICYKVRKTNIDILRGIRDDPRSFSLIYSLDETDSWQDETVWQKANPNMGKSVYLSYLRDQYVKAITEGSTAEFQFRVKNMNQWITSGSTFIRDEIWMKSGTNYDPDILNGRECFVGMDLSTLLDLTCLIFLFPPDENDSKFRVWCKFYCPDERIEKRSRTDKVPYEEWAQKGFIKATPGKTIDYNYLIQDLTEARQRFKIKCLEYDPALAHKVIEDVKNLGLTCYSFGQGTKEMNAPIRHIQALIEEQRLDHGNHPILRWNISNVALYTDTGDKVRFDKRKIVERIDGAVGLAMAIGGYLTEAPTGVSKYEREELAGI